jgi:topoisomerase-4 subunit A
VILVDLDPKDSLVDCALVLESGLLVEGEGRTGKPQSEVLGRDQLLAFVGKRARKAKPTELRFKPKRLRTGG